MKLAHYADPSQPNIGDLRDSEPLERYFSQRSSPGSA